MRVSWKTPNRRINQIPDEPRRAKRRGFSLRILMLRYHIKGMRMRISLPCKALAITPILVALAGCNAPAEETSQIAHMIPPEAVSEAPKQEFGFMEAMEEPSFSSPSGDEIAEREAQNAAAQARNGRQDQDVSRDRTAPKIAYSYAAGFRVDAERLEGLQRQHVKQCEALGDDCRILNLTSAGDSDFGYGELRLQVVASKASAFGEGLSGSLEGYDAEQVSYAISGVDLTEQLIDTEAHLEGRRVLRDRLMEVLRKQSGTVGEIVEAERGVAKVNEEIDAAASKLSSLRNRVRFSQFDIEYSPRLGRSTVGFWAPVETAFSSIGTILGGLFAVLIYVLTVLIPLIAIALGLRWVWRKSGLKLRKSPEPSAEQEPAT